MLVCFLVCLFSLLPHHAACEILVPWPGIEPMPPSVEVQSVNHWATRHVSARLFLFSFWAAWMVLRLGTFAASMLEPVPSQGDWRLHSKPLYNRPLRLPGHCILSTQGTASTQNTGVEWESSSPRASTATQGVWRPTLPWTLASLVSAASGLLIRLSRPSPSIMVTTDHTWRCTLSFN